MHLADIPMICVLVGLALYAVLAGADFGAGFWQLTTLPGAASHSPARRARAERIRAHAHHAMGPVWEANHVWLVFVLTVTWTAYPRAFGAIAATLAIPLFLAGIGIVFRGAAYALRAGAASPRESGAIDTVFSLSSLLTPFALGTIVGAIASRRVRPGGDGAHDLISSWTSATSILVGVLAVAVSAYLAAVYLAADAARHGDAELTERFRARALGMAVIAGAAALGGLAVLHHDAQPLQHRLLDGPGLIGVVISVAGGLATVGCVLRRRFELGRVGAALAVVGLIAGWALAQQPLLLPGLTITAAAAPRETLVLVLVAIAIGAVVLFPSLAFLFGLVLHGRFDAGRAGATAADAVISPGAVLAASAGGLAARAAVAGLIGGLGLLTAADAAWAHALGVVSLAVCAVAAFRAVDPAALGAEDSLGELTETPASRRTYETPTNETSP